MSRAMAVNGKELSRPEYTLRLAAVGEDVPVLLIHQGLGSFAAHCDPERDAIAMGIAARGCRVLGFDLCGHGGSTAVAEFAEDFLDRSVEDAAAVLDDFGVTTAAAAIGIGFGGLVALRLATLKPRRVRCVVADSIPGILTSTPFEPWLSTRPEREDGYDMLPPWLRYIASFRGLSDCFPPGFRIDVPALLTACGAGSAGETTRLYNVARAIGGAEVKWAPTEFPPTCWSAPRFFLDEVEQFLAAYA